jgi:hypothetical protein
MIIHKYEMGFFCLLLTPIKKAAPTTERLFSFQKQNPKNQFPTSPLIFKVW